MSLELKVGRRLHWAWLIGATGAVLGACSLANSPEDPIDPGATGGTGGTSSVGGATTTTTTTGGAGGTTGTGGSAAVCGNGTIEGDEDCDDGAATATCDTDCTMAECGDGTPNRLAMEECDDGNADENDACSATCLALALVIEPNGPDNPNVTIGIRPKARRMTIGGEERFLVVSVDSNPNGTQKQVFYQVVNVDGTVMIPRAALSNAGNNLEGVSVAVSPLGGAMAVWMTAAESRYAVIDANGGLALGASAVPGSANTDSLPVVASGTDGGYLVSWVTNEPQNPVRVLRADEAGAFVGAPAVVGNMRRDSEGSFFGTHDVISTLNLYTVVFPQLASNGDIYGRSVTLAGAPNGAAYLIAPTNDENNFVATGFGDPQSGAFVAAFGQTDFFGNATDELRGQYRRFGSANTPLAPAQLVAATHRRDLGTSLVSGATRFLAATSQYVPGGANPFRCDMRGRQFALNSGQPVGPEFDVSGPDPDRCLLSPGLATSSAGDLAVVWAEWDSAAVTPNVSTVKLKIYRNFLD